MEKPTHSEKFLRQRKFFLVAPAMVLPFIFIIFYAMGGGGGTGSQKVAKEGGLNLSLPEAQVESNAAHDKMSFYKKALQDSLKRKKQMEGDPYFQGWGVEDEALSDLSADPSPYQTSPGYRGRYTDPNERKVYERLEALNHVMNQQNEYGSQRYASDHKAAGYNPAGRYANEQYDLSRFEQIAAQMKSEKSEEDPELTQLNSMLERILDIQHPERVEGKLKENASKQRGQVYAVTNKPDSLQIGYMPVNLLEEITMEGENSFYSLDYHDEATIQNAIEAVVHGDQTIVNGTTVKMRLVNDVYVNGVIIPKDNFLYGTATLQGERLMIKVNSIRFGRSLYAISLSVFDLDGMNGIHIPGAIAREVVKTSGDQAIRGFGMPMDPSLGAQAASAGIDAAQSLLSRKVRLVKVNVKSEYRVLLRDDKQKDN